MPAEAVLSKDMTSTVDGGTITPAPDLWYVNVGEKAGRYEDGTNRSWEDEREFGFVSGGRAEKSTQQIRRLKAGHHIYVYLSEHGYVGYGEVLADPVPAQEMVLSDGRRLADVNLRERGMIDYDPSVDDSLKEWAAPLHWIRTFGRDEAKTFSRIFSWPGAACKLSNQQTIDFLAGEFGVSSTRLPREPRVWIENTIVVGLQDRLEGENRLGEALWSPQQAKNGAGICRFMRDVVIGDVVLHLTDNQAFTGISEAVAPAENFGGVAGTEWGAEPSYRVQLANFQKLDPPLPREVFFESPYRERLMQLIEAGQKNLFYNAAPALNQGAYLTPASPALVRILNDAYQSISGRPLIPMFLDGQSGPIVEASEDALAFDRLVKATLWTEARLSEIIDAVLHPVKPARQIILAGPPGTSKTFVAQELVRYLTRDDEQRAHLVQFHPSYSYEQFIEGLRPSVTDGGSIQFRPEPGIVLGLADKCRRTDDNHFLIIDEFNRANLSRVLGELMYLFEYRDRAIDLPYTRDFSLPPNLFFIATMNTADRSIRNIDIALRRRFEVFECPADPALLDRYYTRPGYQSDIQGLSEGLARLNKRLTEELDEHHTVGHAFFMARHFTVEDLQNVWKRKIRPLLSEYFFASPETAASFELAAFWPHASAQ